MEAGGSALFTTSRRRSTRVRLAVPVIVTSFSPVNHWTLDYGEKGRQAVQKLLDWGAEEGILPSRVKVDFFP